MSNKFKVKKDNDENTLLLRNLIYKFCKIHNYKVEITYNEQTHLMTFEIEDNQK